MTDPPDPPADAGNVSPIRPGIPEPRPGRGQGQQESAQVLAVRALELRMSALSYQQIADALELSNKGQAYTYVQAALRVDNARVAGLREEYRDIQLARTERLTRAHWVKALDGDLDHARFVLALMERQARLIGLDAPKQVQVSTGVDQAAEDALTALRDVVIGEVLDTHDLPLPAEDPDDDRNG